ncbi:MAG: hypothetical protein K8Q91_00690 [Candidatus Vogelbacteria bacterium]|nr:hypothetical protein [Candidatus Vogelbacteria bacterium]
MSLSRRKILLVVWFISVVATGVLVFNGSGIMAYGWAASLALIAISLGVPLMRAFTEFSK